jgi:hypothetical protein
MPITCWGRRVAPASRGGVAGQDRVGPQRAVELREQRELELELLGGGLDDHVALRQRSDRRGGGDALQDRPALGGGQALLGDQAAQIGADPLDPGPHGGLAHVIDEDIELGLRGHLGDAAPHLARAHHADPLDFQHLRSPLLLLCGDESEGRAGAARPASARLRLAARAAAC